MNAPIAHSAISEADERALLDSVDRWLTRKVAPVADSFEQADEYPAELVADMCEMGLYGALIDPEYGGLGLSAVTYSRLVVAHLRRVDEPHRLLQQPPDDGAHRPEVRHPRAEGSLAAEVRHRRAARRPGPHRSRRGHRPAGHPHGRPPRRRRLRGRRGQAVDHQRAGGRRPGPAGQDRPRSPAAPQGHDHADRADPRHGDARGAAGRAARAQAAQARLSRHRHRRDQLRGLSLRRAPSAWSAARRARAS